MHFTAHHRLPTWARVILVLLWMSMIFYLSSIPSLQSSLPSTLDLVARKIAHMLEYAILTWLIWFMVYEAPLFKSTKILLAISIALAYAISDEFHQTFVPGRSGAAMDVFIDGVGIILMGMWLKRKN